MHTELLDNKGHNITNIIIYKTFRASLYSFGSLCCYNNVNRFLSILHSQQHILSQQIPPITINTSDIIILYYIDYSAFQVGCPNMQCTDLKLLKFKRVRMGKRHDTMAKIYWAIVCMWGM